MTRVNYLGELQTDSVSTDLMAHSVGHDFGLHCLLRPVCPNTACKYSIDLDVTDRTEIQFDVGHRP